MTLIWATYRESRRVRSLGWRMKHNTIFNLLNWNQHIGFLLGPNLHKPLSSQSSNRLKDKCLICLQSAWIKSCTTRQVPRESVTNKVLLFSCPHLFIHRFSFHPCSVRTRLDSAGNVCVSGKFKRSDLTLLYQYLPRSLQASTGKSNKRKQQ